LLRLNWAYGIGELLIVVVGVMIALGFEQWNSDRLDRVEEVEIIERFIADLGIDLGEIASGMLAISGKETALSRISSSLESPETRPRDLTLFLQDVVDSASYGWNQGTPRRTTFDEVLASGRFSLIRDTATRVRIADYYEWNLNRENRIEERETDYPNLSYRLVPRVTEFELATDLSDAQLEELINIVLSSPLPEHVAGEMNFTRFLSEQFTEWREFSLALIDELEFYRSTIS
jgi:hypothetical protein